jgi:hypothetical protein
VVVSATLQDLLTLTLMHTNLRSDTNRTYNDAKRLCMYVPSPAFCVSKPQRNTRGTPPHSGVPFLPAPGRSAGQKPGKPSPSCGAARQCSKQQGAGLPSKANHQLEEASGFQEQQLIKSCTKESFPPQNGEALLLRPVPKIN